MDDLIKEFINETVESLSEMDLDLVALESDPTNQDLLGKVFRLMHTIKGTCGFIGLSRLEKVAHSSENLLDDFRSGKMDITEEAMTLIFLSIDRIRYLTGEIGSSGKEPDGDDSDLVKALDAIRTKGEVSSTPAKPETPSEPVIAEEPVAAQETAPAKQPEAPAVEKKQVAESKEPEYLRVQMSVLEEMINMVSELVLTRNQLLQMIRMEENSTLHPPFQRLNRIVSDLQDSVMKTRMQPIKHAWAKLPRIVRDLSTESGKKIVLEMEGEETELDRQVLELIKDPLTHMIRNSCDHGIEPPQERTRSGKPEHGTIHLSSYHEGGFIVVRIEDDGKGLDPQKILCKALEKGLVEPDKVDTLTEKQVLNFIMRPGFSTAGQITNVSGRGVGMDVVRANIEKIGGTIDMESTLGKGTVFTIQIPLTLAIISGLICEIDGHRYAIPQINIQELVSLQQADTETIEYINNKPVIRLRDRIIPLLDSATLFHQPADDLFQPQPNKEIIVINVGTSFYGLLVDQIFDTEEVVIKSVSSVLKSATIFSGNTILGDGQVIMILDPAAIARKFNVEKEASHIQQAAAQSIAAKQALQKESASMLIVKAGNGTHKAVPLSLISRLHVFAREDITRSADKLIVKHDDKLMQLSLIDGSEEALEKDEVCVMLISDDRSEAALGLVIDEVIDIAEGELNLTTATMRDGILGSMLLNEETVDVLDITHFLAHNQSDWFSSKAHSGVPFLYTHARSDAPQAQAPAAASEESHSTFNVELPPPAAPQLTLVKNASNKPRLLLVDDSNFFRNMLHPILTSAGYEVTLAEHALEAIDLHDQGYVFDIILSDIEMPEMNGYDFVEKMRADSAWKELPFIAITSHNTPQDVEYGYKKGFNHYVGKLNKEELIQTLATSRHG